MKKLLTWLFSDFLYTLYEWAEQKFTLSAAAPSMFALFKNGTELPNTRFTAFPPTYITAPQQAFSIFEQGGYREIVGNATIEITQNEIDLNTGDIELRAVGGNTYLDGPDLGGGPTNAVRASLNFEKVGEPIIP